MALMVHWSPNRLRDDCKNRIVLDSTPTYRVFLYMRSVGLTKGSCPAKCGVLSSETEENVIPQERTTTTNPTHPPDGEKQRQKTANFTDACFSFS